MPYAIIPMLAQQYMGRMIPHYRTFDLKLSRTISFMLLLGYIRGAIPMLPTYQRIINAMSILANVRNFSIAHFIIDVAVKKNPSTKFSHKFNTKDYWKNIFTNGDLKHKYIYQSIIQIDKSTVRHILSKNISHSHYI